jgi:predicted DNA-binding transcriptional regulator YafY
MAKTYSRIHRLLRIFNLIQSGPGWNATRLAEECKTSERNVYRDLKAIDAAGIPYFFDKQTGSYTIRRDFFMPAVELTLEESLALVALGQVATTEQVPFMKPAARAVAKIRNQLPAKIRDALGESEEQIEMDLARSSTGEGVEDVYETVKRAITQRRALLCTYEPAKKTVGTKNDAFLFKPYKLFFSQRAWYAIGRHESRSQVRSLRLNRFDSIKPTDISYSIPAGFSVQKHLGNAWRMIRGEKSYDVELLFDADFAETISDTAWHPTQETEPADNDGLIFRCKVDGLSEIVWWILSMGRHCKVVKPPELIDLVQKETREMLKHYEAPQERPASQETQSVAPMAPSTPRRRPAIRNRETVSNKT